MHSLRVVQGGVPEDGKKRFLAVLEATSANQGKRAMEGLAAFVQDLEAESERLLLRQRVYDVKAGQTRNIALKRDDETLHVLLAYGPGERVVVTFVAAVRNVREQRWYEEFRQKIVEESARYRSLLG